jgi:hypothetical protein
VIFRSCDSGNHHTNFLNLYGRFCPYNPPYKPGEKISTPPFLEDENIFQKSATLVVFLLQFRLQPTWPIFEKCSHLREKGEVLMLFQTTRHLGAKAQYGHAHAVDACPVCKSCKNARGRSLHLQALAGSGKTSAPPPKQSKNKTRVYLISGLRVHVLVCFSACAFGTVPPKRGGASWICFRGVGGLYESYVLWRAISAKTILRLSKMSVHAGFLGESQFY